MCEYGHAYTCLQYFFSVLNSTPLLKDLYRVVTPDYATQWKTIGGLLGLPTACLDTAEAENLTNLQRCCNEMLKMWLARNTNATWKDVLAAIDSPTITQGVLSLSDAPQINGTYLVSKCLQFLKASLCSILLTL